MGRGLGLGFRGYVGSKLTLNPRPQAKSQEAPWWARGLGLGFRAYVGSKLTLKETTEMEVAITDHPSFLYITARSLRHAKGLISKT